MVTILSIICAVLTAAIVVLCHILADTWREAQSRERWVERLQKEARGYKNRIDALEEENDELKNTLQERDYDMQALMGRHKADEWEIATLTHQLDMAENRIQEMQQDQ